MSWHPTGLLAIGLFSCPCQAQTDNVLLILADDLGVDRVVVYGEHPNAGRTPHIDELAARGVLFRNAWSSPTCTSTRSTIVTGRYAFRTGMGHGTMFDDYGLPLEEVTLPEVLRRIGWTSVVLGKWHLGSDGQYPWHPLHSGFDFHAGSYFNLEPVDGEPSSYFHWPKLVQGVETVSTTYATTDTTDDAIRSIRLLPEPWLLYLPYNAPHGPLHAPPRHLHTFDLSGPPEDTPAEHHKAMTEALDTELGRLFASIDPAVLARTTVLFVGDNGTPGGWTEPPFLPNHGKGTVFEGGINVPLIIAGPRVRHPGSECTALVNTTDLFATVVEIASHGGGAPPLRVDLDSVSLVPYLANPDRPSLREIAYAEWFAPNGFGPFERHDQAIRGERYKLIRKSQGEREYFYDLELDPLETRDLFRGGLSEDEQAVYEWLLRKLDSLLGSA